MVCKGETPIKLALHQQRNNVQLEIDQFNTPCYVALCMVYTKYSYDAASLHVYTRAGVFVAAKKHANGSLAFVQWTPLSNISTKEGISSVSLGKTVEGES